MDNINMKKETSALYYLRIGGALLLVCAVVALVLSFVNNVTRDRIAQNEAKQKKKTSPPACQCPGTSAKAFERKNDTLPFSTSTVPSRLRQWPCQIKLVPTNAPYFDNAHLLVAADCTAYAYGNFHNDFIGNKITLIGCPKLDSVDYSEKLTAIIAGNNIKSVTVVRMEVPCCGGIENAVKKALMNSGKFIPWQVITISTDGRIIE